jgi:hypothetical protein
MIRRSIPKIQANWENLLAGIEANKEDLPYVEGFCVSLQAQLSDLKADLARRSAIQLEARRLTQVIQESLEEGRDLASRISSYLRAKYGPGSRKLVEFGLTPNGRRRKGSPETCHHG